MPRLPDVVDPRQRTIILYTRYKTAYVYIMSIIFMIINIAANNNIRALHTT